MEGNGKASDAEEDIFAGMAHKRATAVIVADEAGIISGAAAAATAVRQAGLEIVSMLEEGSEVAEGDEIARFAGAPGLIARVGDDIIGLLAKTSGVATSARAFVKAAGKKPRIVCGAWRKVPPGEREAVRQAIATGGADCSITERPHLYLDANQVEMFGGTREAVEAAARLASERNVVVQIKGRHGGVSKEALEAAECGAGIVFIDTGVNLDFMETAFELDRAGLRRKVKVAFGGDLDIKDVRGIKKDKFGIDIVDVGVKIADAPLLGMHLEIVAVEETAP